MSINLILGVHSAELPEAAELGFDLAHILYRVDGSGALLRAQCPEAEGHTMVLDLTHAGGSSGALPGVVRGELARGGYRSLLLETERATREVQALSGALCRTATEAGVTVWAPPELAAACGSGSVVVSSAVTSGNFRGTLAEFKRRYGRVALELEPLGRDYTLPASAGAWTQLAPGEAEHRRGETRGRVFYSEQLRANYYHYRAGATQHMVLWDTPSTLRAKLSVAEALGVETAFALYDELRGELNSFAPYRRGGSRV